MSNDLPENIKLLFTSTIDLTALYTDGYSIDDFRSAWKEIGLFNPVIYIDNIKKAREEAQKFQIQIPFVGELSLRVGYSLSSFYLGNAEIAMKLNLNYVFLLPLVAKSRWKELKEEKTFLFREELNIYPFYAVYRVFFQINPKLELKPLAFLKKQKYLRKVYEKLRDQRKRALIKALFPPPHNDVLEKLYFPTSPENTIIFGKNLNLKDLNLKRSTIKGYCTNLNEATNSYDKTEWYYFRRENTFFLKGSRFPTIFTKKFIQIIDSWMFFQNIRGRIAANIQEILDGTIRFTTGETQNDLRKISQDFLKNLKILFTTFAISYNPSFYFEEQSFILRKSWQRNLLEQLTKENNLQISYDNQLRQIMDLIIIWNDKMIPHLKEWIKELRCAELKQLFESILQEGEENFIDYSEGIELSDTHETILNILIDEYLYQRNHSKQRITPKKKHLWPCLKPGQILTKTDTIKKNRIYARDGGGFVLIRSLKAFGLLQIKSDPNKTSHNYFCLNLENKNIKSLIYKREKEISQKRKEIL